jgi:CRP-like cAMP-binding protein
MSARQDQNEALCLSKGSILPIKTYRLWQIRSGMMKTSTYLEDGAMLVLGIWGPRDLVGPVLTSVQPYRIECLTQVTAIPLSIDNHPQLSSLLFEHVNQLEELMIIRSYRKIEIMVLKLLVWMSKRYGSSSGTGQLIDLRLTHQDLADVLGTTRVSITRSLAQLEQQGVIERLPLGRTIVKEESFWHYDI